MGKKNPFAKLYNTDLTGEEKTEKFKELAKALKSKTPDEPRSNVGDYDESKYSNTRKKYIAMARRKGSTSAADMEKALDIKNAARRAAYAVGKTGTKIITGGGILTELLDPTELGAAERMSDELKSDLNQMEEYGEKKDITSEEDSFKKGGRVKKAKGGLIRGFPKIAKRGF
jgi:hypothetical protein